MMKLRLSWTDPVSERPRRPLLNAPIALGQGFESMPSEISGKSVSRMVISDHQILDFQALIVEIEGEIYLIANGGQTYVNQQPVKEQQHLHHGDRIRIGQTELQLQVITAPPDPSSPSSTTHLQAVTGPSIAPEQANLNGNSSYNGNGNGHRPVASPAHADPMSSASPEIPPNAHSGNPLNGHGLPQNERSHHDLSHHEPSQHDPSHHDYSSAHSPEASQQSSPSSSPFNGQLGNAYLAHGQEQPLAQNHLPQNHSARDRNEDMPGENGHAPCNGLASSAENNGHARRPNPDPAHAPSYPTPAPQVPTPGTIHNPQPLELHSSEPNSGCQRMVGFLFKRPCGRPNNQGCDQCANAGYSSHAYHEDYGLYEGFGRFEPGDWGYGLLTNQTQP